MYGLCAAHPGRAGVGDENARLARLVQVEKSESLVSAEQTAVALRHP